MKKIAFVVLFLVAAFVVAQLRSVQAGKPCRVDCPTHTPPPIVTPTV